MASPVQLPDAAEHPDTISIKGARQNNLRGFDLEIPHGTLTVVTGVSGSDASRLWRFKRSTPKASVATSNRVRRTRGSFWIAWRGPRSIR